MGSVSIRKVVKSYGAVEALHGIDVDIADGEFTVLVGPSGCGKSTLLRMVAGLETVTGGEITIDGKRINDLEPKDRDIAMVFQNYALYPQMTVAQNMGFALEMQRKPRHVIDTEVAKAAEILSLGALLDRKPGQLSGGQRQRVAMGRAIVRHPSVFLFDEPLSNLDAKLRVQMRAEIKALHQRLKSTIIYVTHDQIEAMTMADKIVVMNGGRVEQIGTPLALYDRPANIFVAGFMGSPAMNLLPAAIEGDDLIVPGMRLPAPSGIPTGRQLTLGIRPEHVLIGQGSPARVLLSEPTGPELHLTVNFGGQNVVLATRERLAAQPGSEVFVRFDPTHCHVFDSETGLRVETPAPSLARS